MKKKILLLLTMVVVLACALAISASAEDAIPDFTDVINVTAVGNGVVAPIDTSSLSTLEAVVNDNTSRVLLKDENGNYATYLAKYITTTAKTGAGDYGMNFKFDALNAATGKEYKPASVVRFEIPEGVERLYSATLSGCTDLLSIKCGSTFWVIENNVFNGSNCPSLRVVDFSASTKTAIKTTVNSVFASNASIEEVRLPRNLVEMAKTAFHNDSSLKRVYIPSTFTTTTSIVNQSSAKTTFFYTGDIETAQSVFPAMMPSSFTIKLEYVEWDYTKSDDYYVELTQNHSSTYVIYIVCGYSDCNAFYSGEHTEDNNPCVINCTRCNVNGAAESNPVHSESTTIVYTSYDVQGSKITTCTNEGCEHCVTEQTPALFTCLGYSSPITGDRAGIVVGFTIDKEAINEYTSVTGKTLEYGAFAVLESKIGTSDIIDGSGEALKGVIKANVTSYSITTLELKIVGFKTDSDKALSIAMGAYVIASDSAGRSISYMQEGAPATGAKYSFVTYNEIAS